LRGLYSKALQGLSRVRQQLTGSSRHIALCDLDEAEFNLQLNLSQEAASLAIRAMEQFDQIGMRYEEAKARTFYGVALMQMQRFGEALDIFRTAQKGFEVEGNDYWVALLEVHGADVHLALHRYREARSLATKARQCFENLGIPSRRMLSLVLLARIAIALDEVATAEVHLAQISSIIDHTSRAAVVISLSRPLRASCRDQEALEAGRTGISPGGRGFRAAPGPAAA
jgi:tetratricopeptide (TPR) repeat protein